jgi:hypothetical protein
VLVENLSHNNGVNQRHKQMDPFLAEQQTDEMIPFDWDDEKTKSEVEEYYGYDDLSFGLPLDSTNDF